MEKFIIDTNNGWCSNEGNLFKVIIIGLEHIGYVREIRVFKGEWGTIRLLRKCSDKSYIYVKEIQPKENNTKEQFQNYWTIINEIPEWVFKHSPYLKMEEDIDD